MNWLLSLITGIFYEPRLLILRFRPLEREECLMYPSDRREGGLSVYNADGGWEIVSDPELPNSASAADAPFNLRRRFKLHFGDQPEVHFHFVTFEMSTCVATGSFSLSGLTPEQNVDMGQNHGIGSRSHLLVGRGRTSGTQPHILRPRKGEQVTTLVFQGMRTNALSCPPVYLIIIPAGCRSVPELILDSGEAHLLIYKDEGKKQIEWAIVYDGDAETLAGDWISTDVRSKDELLTHDLT